MGRGWGGGGEGVWRGWGGAVEGNDDLNAFQQSAMENMPKPYTSIPEYCVSCKYTDLDPSLEPVLTSGVTNKETV